MQDSKSRPSETGFLRTCKRQLKSIGGRLAKDVKSVAFSEESELNVFATASLIGATAFFAPWLFTLAGVASVTGAALSAASQPEEEELQPELQPELEPELEPELQPEAC